MKIDYRLYPGISGAPPSEELIVRECKEFLCVDKLIGRKSDVSGCKRMITFLIWKNYNDWSLQKIGDVVNVDHASVLHYRKTYFDMYNGESKFYTFALLNLQAKVSGSKSYLMSEIYVEVIEEMKIREIDKIIALGFLNSKKSSNKTRNPIVRAFILWFLKQGLSGPEICALIGLKEGSVLKNTNLLDKHLYLSVIDSVVEDKINKLKPLKNAKRKTNN